MFESPDPGCCQPFQLVSSISTTRCSGFEIPNSEAKNDFLASGLQIRKSVNLRMLCINVGAENFQPLRVFFPSRFVSLRTLNRYYKVVGDEDETNNGVSVGKTESNRLLYLQNTRGLNSGKESG